MFDSGSFRSINEVFTVLGFMGFSSRLVEILGKEETPNFDHEAR